MDDHQNILIPPLLALCSVQGFVCSFPVTVISMWRQVHSMEGKQGTAFKMEAVTWHKQPKKVLNIQQNSQAASRQFPQIFITIFTNNQKLLLRSWVVLIKYRIHKNFEINPSLETFLSRKK